MKKLVFILFIISLFGCVSSKHIKYYESFKKMNALEHRIMKRDIDTVREDFYDERKKNTEGNATGNFIADVKKLKAFFMCDLKEAYEIYKRIKWGK